MNEKVKLIIEMPKDYYEIIKHNVENHLTDYRPFEIIANGIPLDNDSERAEVQAYFAGQTYGWEQGRKALIEDLKAEIVDKAIKDASGEGFIFLGRLLRILDNIGIKDPNDLTHIFDGVTEIPKDVFKDWDTDALLEQIRAESEGKE